MRNTATILLAAVLGLAISAVAAVAADSGDKPAAERPNILVILADDMGYGELTCQGNPEIPTPNIDSIAKNGIRFTSGYVSAPLCSPSRAGLMMGRYQQHFGHEFNPGGGETGPHFGLPTDSRTFAERMKAAGYATGMFGKWHLGYAKPTLPKARGFDWYYGFLGACRPYPIRNKTEMGKSLLPDANYNYTSDAFAAETAAFIEQHKDVPWFVYLPFNAVHASPASSRGVVPADGGKYRDRFPNIKDERRRTYAGMESGLDDAVGVVLAKIRQLNLEENTLIFFFSDNGGPTWQTTSRNDPLSGSKGHVLEGGIREPFLVQWKGHLPAGKVDDRPIISLDILPTALNAAGAPPADMAKLDGVNLLPYLTGARTDAPHKALFWRFGSKRAVRMGDWKLTDEGDGFKLYNLSTDIAEKTDLTAKEPAKVKELTAAYEAWNVKNIPPRWGGEKPGKNRAGGSKAPPLAFIMEDDP